MQADAEDHSGRHEACGCPPLADGTAGRFDQGDGAQDKWIKGQHALFQVPFAFENEPPAHAR